MPSAAVPPGADSDSVAVSDSPVSLPDPTLDGEGAGGTDPFEIPPFLRRGPLGVALDVSEKT